jgi:hypothetical protein
MADLSFQPVADKVRVPEVTSLGDMINTARGGQAYQQAQQINPLALRQQQAATALAEGTLQPKISQAGSESAQAATSAESTKMDLQNKKTKAISSGYIGMINDPMIVQAEKDPASVNPYQLAKAIEKWGITQGKNAGVDEAKTQELVQPYIDIAMKDPSKLRDYLKARHIAGLDSAAQQSALTPTGIQVSTGAGGYVAGTSPFVGKQGEPVAGTKFTAELPPTTPVIRNGVPGYLGAQNLQSTMTPAQTAASTGSGAVVSNDWSETSKGAAEAPGRIAIFQNIKKLVPESFTGALGEKKQFASSLAQSLGLNVKELEASSTDELAKNTKLLALAGGNTDSARALAELANPNNKMTKEGMIRVTNQLLGLENYKSAKGRFLQDVSNNPDAYQQKLFQWNNAADPRFFQEMSKEEAQKAFAAMSPTEITALRQKKAMAKQLGILP